MKLLLTITLVFFILLGVIHTRPALADAPPIAQPMPTETSPSPSPTPDEELDAAKREAALAAEKQKKAEAEQEEAEARKAKLKAEVEPLTDPKVTAPTGGVTTDQAGFVESQMLAQEAAREITARLSGALCKGQPVKINTLVIYNASDMTALALYVSMLDQLRQFKKEFQTKNDETEDLLGMTVPVVVPTPTPDGGVRVQSDPLSMAIAAPGIATGLIKSVAELVNLFRTDTEFKNKPVTIPEDMVVSYLVQNLNQSSMTYNGNTSAPCSGKPVIYYPNLFPPNLLTGSNGSTLLTELQQISEKKSVAANDIKRIDARVKLISGIAEAIQKQKDLTKEKANKVTDQSARQAELAKLGGAKCKTARCKKLNADIDALDAEIDKLNDDLRKTQATFDAFTEKNKGKVLVDDFAKNFESWLAMLKDLKGKTQLLIDSAELITSKLNTPDEATKLTAMAQLLRAERLASILAKQGSYTLRVAVTANGTTKIKKNLFVDAKVRHSAGANLVYQLFDKDGQMVMGDAMQFYYDYKSSSDVRQEVESKNQPKSTNGNGSNSASNNTAATPVSTGRKGQ